MIELKNLTKKFGEKTAVKQLSLTLEPGTITGFIGPNGAGKSTTIRMLCGILQPDEGSVVINGHDMATDPLGAKSEFGFISDNPDLFTTLQGLEYIHFVADVYGVSKKEREDRIEELLDTFEMREAIENRIASYSHGMRQKIHIIATLVHDPNVWIMDEPMTGLDPQSSFLLKKRMKEHAAKGNIVLFSTHVLEVAEKLCDRIAIINRGEIKYTGTLETLKERYPKESLENIFLRVTESTVFQSGAADEGAHKSQNTVSTVSERLNDFTKQEEER